jgi:hypothetical protein
MDTAQLTLVRQPFDHRDFPFELKHDGGAAMKLLSPLFRILIIFHANAAQRSAQRRENKVAVLSEK